MPRCLKCKDLIDHVRHYTVSEGAGDLAMVNGEPVETEALPLEHIRDDYECPDCGEKLFETEEDAAEFLSEKLEIPAAPQHEEEGFDDD